MIVLTDEERRLALLVAGLLALGAVHDAWIGHLHRHAPRVAAGVEAPLDSAMADPRVATPARDVAGAPAREPGGARPAPPAPVDLNRATERDLDALPGVGPVLARRIVEHRRRNGPFRDRRDLAAVKGIGPRLLERLAPYVTVSPNP